MKTQIIVVSLFLGCSKIWAVDCNNPPPSWGSSYSGYASWCRACGGTPYNNNGVGCRPGPNWGGGSGAGGGVGTGNPAADMIVPIMQEGIKQFFAPSQETPEQRAEREERQRQSAELARQEAEKARIAEEAYQREQDQKAMQFLDIMKDALKDPVKSQPESQDFRAKLQCKGGEPGIYSCYVLVCGGAYGGDPVCCPEGYPKLNECDCNCYPSKAEFECNRYAACQYSYKAPDLSGGPK